jgi:hypothetical protein
MHEIPNFPFPSPHDAKPADPIAERKQERNDTAKTRQADRKDQAR